MPPGKLSHIVGVGLSSSDVSTARRRDSILSNDCHWALIASSYRRRGSVVANDRQVAHSAVCNGRRRDSAVTNDRQRALARCVH